MGQNDVTNIFETAPHRCGGATLSLLSPPGRHLKDRARPDLSLPTADSAKQFTITAHLSAWDVGNPSKSEKLCLQEVQGQRPWLCHTPGLLQEQAFSINANFLLALENKIISIYTC